MSDKHIEVVERSEVARVPDDVFDGAPIIKRHAQRCMLEAFTEYERNHATIGNEVKITFRIEKWPSKKDEK